MKSKSNRHAYQSKACFTVRLFLLLLAAVLFAPAVSAQNNQRVDKSRYGRIKAGICKVIGKVVDTGKNPLPGVHIYVVGSTQRTVTDADGNFSLILQGEGKTHELKATFVGMASNTFKVTIQKGEETKKLPLVTMKEDDKVLDEVVVTGYQIMKRRESASAITSVKAEDVIVPNAMNIDQMLQGKVSGVMVMSQSGEPSSTPTIRIRGNSTINGNKGPVWVVDGVIVSDAVPFSASDLNSPDAAYLIGNGISGLSPQDIESIDVLKDASATAIYGVKAANGVIVITTKKGKASRPVVTYDGSMSINTRPTYGDFDMMNSQERIQLSKDIYDARLQYPRVPMEESYEGALQLLLNKKISQDQFGQMVRKYELMNTNWFKEIFRTTVSQNHSLSVNGGSDKVRYYTSVSYNNSPGIAKTSESERFTAMSKVWFKINKIFDVDVKVNLSHSDNDGYNGVSPFSYAYNTSRAFSPYDDNGNYYYYSKTKLTPISYNILNELDQTGKTSKTNVMGGLFNLNAHIVKGLTYTGTLSYDWSESRLNTWATDRSYSVANIRGYDYGAYKSSDRQYQTSALPVGGTYAADNTSRRSYMLRNTLSYVERFGDHDINLFGGIEIRSDKYNGISTFSYGWDPQYGQSIAPIYTDRYLTAVKQGRFNPNITEKVTQVASYIGSASYTYGNRYVLNANIRSDGSNKFGSNPEYRWLPTWSVAGKWILSNEKFMQNVNFVNHASFRGSYGIQGNIMDDATPNLIVRMNGINSTTGLQEGSIYRLPNPDLRWEKTRSYNIGADFRFFDSRLTLTLDYYHKKTTDLITDMKVSPVTGRSYMYMNAGEALNKGFEGSFSVDILRQKDFDWNVSFNFNHNTNEIKYAYDANLTDKEVYENMIAGNVAAIGQPLGTIYSFKFAGLSAENGYPLFYTKDGRKVYEGDYEMMELVPSGSIYPDVTGGFNTRFTYKKNLTVSLGFSYQLGGVKRLPAIYQDANSAFDPSSNLPKDFIDRWKQPGDENRTNIPALYDATITNNFPVDMVGYYGDNRIAEVSMSTMYDYSDIRVAKSDFLRLSNLMVSYRLPKNWLKKLNISETTVRLQANNLKTWAAKEWKGLDPETAYANMPIMPSFSLGATISF